MEEGRIQEFLKGGVGCVCVCVQTDKQQQFSGGGGVIKLTQKAKRRRKTPLDPDCGRSHRQNLYTQYMHAVTAGVHYTLMLNAPPPLTAVARWAKALLSSRRSSLCFTSLRPKFNPRTGQRPYVWKVSSVTCRRSVVSSGYSGFLHQKTDFIIISPPWYDPGCCWGVKPQ